MWLPLVALASAALSLVALGSMALSLVTLGSVVLSLVTLGSMALSCFRPAHASLFVLHHSLPQLFFFCLQSLNLSLDRAVASFLWKMGPPIFGTTCPMMLS